MNAVQQIRAARKADEGARWIWAACRQGVYRNAHNDKLHDALGSQRILTELFSEELSRAVVLMRLSAMNLEALNTAGDHSVDQLITALRDACDSVSPRRPTPQSNKEETAK